MYEGFLSTYSSDEYLTTQAIYAQLEAWVAQGKRGIEKLRSFLYYEVDEEILEYAKMLYREALVSHFMPQTQKEIQDFVLSKLIMERQQYITDQEVILDILNDDLMTLRVQHSVDKDLFGICSQDMLVTDEVINLQKTQIEEIKDHLVEVRRWIKAACQYIDDERYLHPPDDLFEFVNVDGQLETFKSLDEIA